MYLRVHENEEGRIIAACDKELIGKVLEEGKKHLDLSRHREFYIGELVGEDEMKAALGKFDSANLVGEKVVGVALALGLVSKEDIMYINDIPHIQIYKL